MEVYEDNYITVMIIITVVGLLNAILLIDISFNLILIILFKLNSDSFNQRYNEILKNIEKKFARVHHFLMIY